MNDLEATMGFSSKLGFEFNPRFTDENASCRVVSGAISVMLPAKPFFKGSTQKE